MIETIMFYSEISAIFKYIVHNRYYFHIVITVAKLSGKTSFHDTITDPDFYGKLFMEIALRVRLNNKHKII